MGTDVVITTRKSREFAVLDTNSTNGTAFSQPALSLTKPSGDAIVDVNGANSFLVKPFGTDDADETFDIRIVGYKKGNRSWNPEVLFQATCTLSTQAGIAGGDAVAADHFCDAVTYGSGTAPYRIQAVPANTAISVWVDVLGCDVLEFLFDVNTAASANALVSRL